MKKFPAFISSYINIKEKIRREKNFRHYRRKRIVAMYAWRWGRVLTRKEENEREERVSTLENSLIRENGSRVKRAIILNSRSFNSVSFSCFDGMNLRCKIFFASIDLALNLRVFDDYVGQKAREQEATKVAGKSWACFRRIDSRLVSIKFNRPGLTWHTKSSFTLVIIMLLSPPPLFKYKTTTE